MLGNRRLRDRSRRTSSPTACALPPASSPMIWRRLGRSAMALKTSAVVGALGITQLLYSLMGICHKRTGRQSGRKSACDANSASGQSQKDVRNSSNHLRTGPPTPITTRLSSVSPPSEPVPRAGAHVAGAIEASALPPIRSTASPAPWRFTLPTCTASSARLASSPWRPPTTGDPTLPRRATGSGSSH